MIARQPDHRVLYLSRLAPDCGYDVFASVCHRARRRNPGMGVSTILLFDGFRFCQLLTGPEAAVKALVGRIALDHRHIDMQWLLAQAMPAVDGPASWASGFTEPHVLDVFESPQSTSAKDILTLFAAIVAEADLDGDARRVGLP